MSDISEVTEDAEPKPMTLRVKGVEYSVLPFNMIQVGKIQKAIKTLPCPHNTRAVQREMGAKLAAGECTQADMEQAIAHCAAKEQAWPPRVMESEDAQSILMYEEPVQVAMVRTALRLPDDATARTTLERMHPVDYIKMVFFCFQVGPEESADDPKSPSASTSEPESPSTTTPSSGTSSPAPDGPENTSSGSPSPTSSDTPG